MDGNMLPIVWNSFCSSLGTEKWGSGGEETSSSPGLQKREVGVPGAGFFPPPVLSAPCVTAYASPLTEYSGVGSGRPSNWGRGQSPLPRFGGGGIPPSPGVSAPYVLAHVSPLTNHSGEGSGRTSNWGRGRSPLPRFGSGANYTLTGGGGGNPLPRFGPRTPFETLPAEFLAEF